MQAGGAVGYGISLRRRLARAPALTAAARNRASGSGDGPDLPQLAAPWQLEPPPRPRLRRALRWARGRTWFKVSVFRVIPTTKRRCWPSCSHPAEALRRRRGAPGSIPDGDHPRRSARSRLDLGRKVIGGSSRKGYFLRLVEAGGHSRRSLPGGTARDFAAIEAERSAPPVPPSPHGTSFLGLRARRGRARREVFALAARQPLVKGICPSVRSISRKTALAPEFTGGHRRRGRQWGTWPHRLRAGFARSGNRARAGR